MKLFLNTDVAPFKSDIVERPWGHYGLYSDNEKCTCKILFIKKGECLSLQYHFKRAQFYMALDDGFIVDYSNKPVPQEIVNDSEDQRRFQRLEEFLKSNLITCNIKEGDMFGFHQFVVHRATYNGNREYGRCLDVALGIENDENDIVRIRDKYGRSDNK